MTYEEFYTEATKGIDDKTIDKNTMMVAFVIYQQFDEEPKKALQSSLFLNTL